jgi:hypothetical protein
MNARLEEFTKTFGDLVVYALKSQNVEELETFLAFLVGLTATAENAREAAQDRVQKLKIAKKWQDAN